MSQLWAFPFTASLDLDVTPRTTVFSKGEAEVYRHNYSTEAFYSEGYRDNYSKTYNTASDKKGTGKIHLNDKIYLLIVYDNVA